MAERLLTRRLTTPGTLWVLAVIAAALVFYGTWTFLGAHSPAGTQPHAGVIIHSTPVGGKVEDGVFRSSPDPEADPEVNLWHL